MSMYTDQLKQIINDSEKHTHTIQYLSITLFIGIVIISTLFSLHRQQSERISLKAETHVSDQAKQTLPRNGVAGASATKNGSTSFGVIDSQLQAPALGTNDHCEPGQLFIIGDKEISPLDNPADEFNWVDALDVSPEYTNPFVVNVHQTNQFPWRTENSNVDSQKTMITFNYAGQTAQGELTLSWSPGKQGEKQKSVMLDSLPLGKTPLHAGIFSENNWEFMPIVQDTVSLPLNPGQHTLTIESISNGDGESVWDFIEMRVVGC